MHLTPFHPRFAYRVLLLVHATGESFVGLALLLLPPSRNTGPTTAVLFTHLPRTGWGLLFVAAGLLLAVAAYVDEFWPAIPLTCGVETSFAIGIFWVVFTQSAGSVVGPILILTLAGTSATAALYQRQ